MRDDQRAAMYRRQMEEYKAEREDTQALLKSLRDHLPKLTTPDPNIARWLVSVQEWIEVKIDKEER